jgi:hypothetical protein
LPLASVTSAAAVVDRDIAPYDKELQVEISVGGQYQWVSIPMDVARRWLYLGGDEEAPLFYLVEPDSRLPGLRVVEYFLESPSAYASLHAWAEQGWAGRQQTAGEMARLKLDKSESSRVLEAQ